MAHRYQWTQNADLKEIGFIGKQIICAPKSWDTLTPLNLKVGDVVTIYGRKLHAMILEVHSDLAKRK